MNNSQQSLLTRTSERVTKLIGVVTTGVTLLLWIGVSVCYLWQPDACAAVTVYPSWCWFVGGLFLALILLRAKRQRVALVSIGLWFVFLVVFADTPLSLWRGLWNPPDVVAQPGQIPLRVISLNAHGSSKAVAALEQWQPDLILIQETPGAGTLREVGQTILGENSGLLAGVDASILSRTPLEPVASSVNYTIGKVRVKTGQEVLVVSLRLTPPPFRADLWNPECWRAYRDQRIHQRDELQQLSRRLSELPTDLPVIVGGDFNVNPRDPIFRELPANLRDAFSTAGIGWGNTITNEAPFLRIDQVWVNDFFESVQVFAAVASDTDHRLVLADLLLTSVPQQPLK
ncbi:Endonuclease/Exonuclease/phosphatase family protein [Gimesia maris]|uniref:endonuclease/exonuclease/phosphatase family protein n=1 Tax=Gimesia maris TaxID=122 RepID=UPI00118C995A|nr:endonuclease/exonuclease/phosphatase family protein [Gimesia maris]QDU12954.1 Endonuclease/Exonuclease/phosphatase family protein [Gimesia maris]